MIGRITCLGYDDKMSMTKFRIELDQNTFEILFTSKTSDGLWEEFSSTIADFFDVSKINKEKALKYFIDVIEEIDSNEKNEVGLMFSF